MAVLLTELLIKSLLVLVAGWLALSVLRHRSAAAKHLAISSSLAGALALPLATVVLPRLNVPGLALFQAESGVAVSASFAPQPPDSAARAASPVDGGAETAVRIPKPQSELEQTPSRIALRGASPGQDRGGQWLAVISRHDLDIGSRQVWLDMVLGSWPQLLIAVWAIGAAIVLARIALSFVAAWRLARGAQPQTDPGWIDAAHRAAADLGLRIGIPLCCTPRATVPMAIGMLRPVLLLPAEADRWDADRRRVVLLHELAHIKRRDCLTQAGARAACALYWFNPLVWALASRQVAERERACDDLVLRTGTEAADYANHLLAIARAFKTSRVPSWATVAMARPSQLEGRLLAILDPSRRRLGLTASFSTLALVVTGLALAPLAALEITEGAAEPQIHGVAAMAPASLTQQDSEVAPASDDSIQRHPSASIPRAPRRPVQAVDPVPTVPPIAPIPDVAVIEPAPRRSSAHEASNRRLIDALVTALADKDERVRGQAAEALAGLHDPRAVGGLTVALKDTDPNVRRAAVGGLAELRIEESKGPLLLALADTDPAVREEAISGLGELGDRRHLDAFVAALKDSSAAVRREATQALGQARALSAVEPLIDALDDADSEVRQQAAYALGEIRARSAVPALMAQLANADTEVRQQAAFALGQIGDLQAVDALTALLRDRDVKVRRSAASALSQLVDETDEDDDDEK